MSTQSYLVAGAHVNCKRPLLPPGVTGRSQNISNITEYQRTPCGDTRGIEIPFFANRSVSPVVAILRRDRGQMANPPEVDIGREGGDSIGRLRERLR